MSRPRVLLVTRDRYRLPLDGVQRRRLDALEAELDVHVLASGTDGGGGEGRLRLRRPAPVADGLLFYAELPLRAARELRRIRPDAVLVQGAHEAAAVLLGRRLGGVDVPVVLDLHGDWRTAPRLYGSPLRRALAPVADAVGRAAVRRADGIRTLSAFTTGLVAGLGRTPTAVFPAYVDLGAFLAEEPRPLPVRPQVLFVGVLERYKNADGVIEAWRQAAPRIPGAALHLVGRGREAVLVERLVAELPGQARWTPHLEAEAVAAELDASWCLVLPSRSEGLPRVAIEAFCRGRAVVGSRSGGIPDIVEDGATGLLVDADDTDRLADALVRLLSDRLLAERLGAAARARAPAFACSPEEFAGRVRELVDRVLQSRA